MMTRRNVMGMGLAAAGVLLPLAALHPVARAQTVVSHGSVIASHGRVMRMTKANARVSAVHAVPGEADAMQLFAQGQSLSPQAAATAERRVDMSLDDLTDHVRLLGYYSPWSFTSGKRPLSSTARQADYDAQVFWLIQHHPESVLWNTPYPMLLKRENQAGFLRAEALWRMQTDRQPQDAQMLGNAAEFCLLSDMPTAMRLLMQATAADPKNPKWHSRLAEAYRLQMSHASAAQKSALAQEAFDEYAAAYLLDKQTPFLALDALANAASNATERVTVRQYANDLLRRSESAKDDDSSVNSHFAKLALGRLALQEGNIAEADADLLAAGKPVAPISPAVGIFGPGMSLAKDLLDHGERQTVLTYLIECSQFTTYKKGQILAWINEVQEGKTPDFGIYLFS